MLQVKVRSLVDIKITLYCLFHLSFVNVDTSKEAPLFNMKELLTC